MTMTFRPDEKSNTDQIASYTAIKRAAVIGAGAMGSGIAAQFANAGVAVDLIDIPSEPANGLAEAAVLRQLKIDGFMHPDAARHVRCGNTRDNLEWLSQADWIVEAIVENTNIKKDLYNEIEKYRTPGTIISSNTSTICHADLISGMSEQFQRDFVITHFFNPPRVMPLVEIIASAVTDPLIISKAQNAAELVLGKTVIACYDTPGFIANRIGCYWIAMGILEAKRLELTVEEADAVNAAFGIPRIGVFGCLDLIGLDLVPHVWGSLMKALPAYDDVQNFDLTTDSLIQHMISKGWIGRKAKGGFSRRTSDGLTETIDLVTGHYRPAAPISASSLPGGGKHFSELITDDSRLGRYALSLVSHLVGYAASNATDLAADIGAIDRAMQLGYGWKYGPFQLADQIGVGTLAAAIKESGTEIAPLLEKACREQGFYDNNGFPLSTDGNSRVSLAEDPLAILGKAKSENRLLLKNSVASLWDLGDGIACLELTSKMNSFDPAIFDVLETVLSSETTSFKGLVIGNDHPKAFSVGADLSFITQMVDAGQFDALYEYIRRGQELFLRMKNAPFPIVAAIHGFTLGGGAEFALHAHAIVAHSELTMALPEVKVGLIPAWGGCTELLVRAQASPEFKKGPAATAKSVLDTIMDGSFSRSAQDARSRGFLRKTDVIVMNRRALIAEAKQLTLTLAEDFIAPAPAFVTVGGVSAKLGLLNGLRNLAALGKATEQDLILAEHLANVVTGGPDGDLTRPVTEAELMKLEREALAALVKSPATRARMDHMLATGKPLRN